MVTVNDLFTREMKTDLMREIIKHGVWAVLALSVITYTLWQAARREAVLMEFQREIIPAVQQMAERQQTISTSVERLDAKLDRLLDRAATK